MSTLDISRLLSQPRKHYVGARLQQGRLLTDADFNEGALSDAEDQRKALIDFVGASASPDDGFSIGVPIAEGTSPDQTDLLRPGVSLPAEKFWLGSLRDPGSGAQVGTYVRPVSIRAGTYYLGGMRFELERPEPFMFQRDFLQMKPEDIPDRDRANHATIGTLYYLEAWEQCVTPVEDHEFVEKALGRKDTSVRVRRLRRVRAFEFPNTIQSCRTLFELLAFKFLQFQDPVVPTGALNGATGEQFSRGRLRLEPTQSQTDTNNRNCGVCNVGQGERFLGADNQTLRIMLTDPHHFVWGFDNGAPLYRVKVTGLGSGSSAEIRVTVLSPLKDDAHIPLTDRVVEIIPFGALLDGPLIVDGFEDPHFNKVADLIGAFGRVLEPFDPSTRSFTLVNDAPGIAAMREFVYEWDGRHPGIQQLFHDTGGADERFFFMRLWHDARTNDEIELSAENPNHQALGDTGLLARFEQIGQRGDFWTIAWRPESPEIVVPFRYLGPGGEPPDGPRRFYAPLAFVSGDNGVVEEVEDCRPILRPATDVDCVTFTVGDNRLVRGEFAANPALGLDRGFMSMQQAIDALPGEGGTVLVRPGVYRERVVIDGRKNVALTGCGDDTVLESPELDASQIIHVTGNSSGITVSGFKLRIAEEHGVLIDAQSSAVVSDLTCEVGHYAPGGVAGSGAPLLPGNSGDGIPTEVPLIAADTANDVALSGIVLRPGRRQGILLTRCRGVLVDNVDGAGAGSNDRAPHLPMIELVACQTGVVREVSLKTTGQFGIRLSNATDGTQNADIEIVRIAAECDEWPPTDHRFSRQPKSAIDVEGRRLKVRESRIFMLPRESTHAGIVVGGTDIEVSDNFVEALLDGSAPPRAWGGIQVRGKSERVTVRGNHLRRGVGHGVTLGSLIWKSTSKSRREGAGEDQMIQETQFPFSLQVDGFPTQFIDDASYRPESEGDLTDIAVLHNQIEGFNTNGISSLTVFGLELDGGRDFIQTLRLRIESNRIHANIASPKVEVGEYAPPVAHVARGAVQFESRELKIQRLPVGGIVIGHVSQGDIRSNVVFDNGVSRVVPISGILIANAESVAICNNTVIGNGLRVINNADAPKRGIRAGIAVLLAGLGNPSDESDLVGVFENGGATLSSFGLALKVSNNTVRHPEGRALEVVAAGPVQVDGNYFSSEGFNGDASSNSDRHAIGDVVFIQNLGAPWERFNIATFMGDDVVLPTPNANPIGRGMFNDYVTPRDALIYLRNEVPFSPRHFVGVGGQVLFQNNQVVYDWEPEGFLQPDVPRATFAVAILSLDHTSVSSNQFGMRLVPSSGAELPPAHPDMGTDEVFYSHVFAAGGTVEATSNRIAEPADRARFSLLVLGELAFTVTHNQTMHEVWATGAQPVATYGYGPIAATATVPEDRRENQEMLRKRSGFEGQTFWVYTVGARLFMKILNRPDVLSSASSVPLPGES